MDSLPTRCPRCGATLCHNRVYEPTRVVERVVCLADGWATEWVYPPGTAPARPTR